MAEQAKQKETRSCPFWKGECHIDCMLYMSRSEDIVAKCAITMIAGQLEMESQRKGTRPGLGV